MADKKFSLKQLKKKAEELGIPHKGVSREAIAAHIRTVEGPASEVTE